MHIYLTIEGELIRLATWATAILLIGSLYGFIRLLIDLKQLILSGSESDPPPPSVEEILEERRRRYKAD